MTDEMIRTEWRESGGDIHGPNVETVTMPEAKYFDMRRRILNFGSGLISGVKVAMPIPDGFRITRRGEGVITVSGPNGGCCLDPGDPHIARRTLYELSEAMLSMQAVDVRDECHCATCTCKPGMSKAVRYDLSPAAAEGTIRDELIRMGWTPPALVVDVESTNATAAIAKAESSRRFAEATTVAADTMDRLQAGRATDGDQMVAYGALAAFFNRWSRL